jgi:hypothetical protein
VTDHHESRLDFVAFRAPYGFATRHPQGGFAMDQFVERQNIARYVDQLKTEKDPIKRAMLERLLAEENAKQVSHGNVGK